MTQTLSDCLLAIRTTLRSARSSALAFSAELDAHSQVVRAVETAHQGLRTVLMQWKRVGAASETTVRGLLLRNADGELAIPWKMVEEAFGLSKIISGAVVNTGLPGADVSIVSIALSGCSAARPALRPSLSSAAALDITIRIAAPGLVLGFQLTVFLVAMHSEGLRLVRIGGANTLADDTAWRHHAFPEISRRVCASVERNFDRQQGVPWSLRREHELGELQRGKQWYDLSSLVCSTIHCTPSAHLALSLRLWRKIRATRGRGEAWRYLPDGHAWMNPAQRGQADDDDGNLSSSSPGPDTYAFRLRSECLLGELWLYVRCRANSAYWDKSTEHVECKWKDWGVAQDPSGGTARKLVWKATYFTPWNICTRPEIDWFPLPPRIVCYEWTRLKIPVDIMIGFARVEVSDGKHDLRIAASALGSDYFEHVLPLHASAIAVDVDMPYVSIEIHMRRG